MCECVCVPQCSSQCRSLGAGGDLHAGGGGQAVRGPRPAGQLCLQRLAAGRPGRFPRWIPAHLQPRRRGQQRRFEIRQLRAHLAQQDLDLVAEREAAMQIHHMWGKQSSFQEVDGLASGTSDHHGPVNARKPGGAAVHHGQDDMNKYISQYYSEPSSDMGI
uniref:transmembrane protein 266-like isoform X3 n=1 Tax=Gasterosteus aculeatus aculeatus TaxID=481459 RepID=UPI001A9984BA|nr:transmembrane protein 266-like isoform X3 [Gasterosteus aculeatus aculeatus]